MGYSRQETVYRLRFTDPAMAGLVVDTRSLSLGRMLEVMALADQVDGKGVKNVQEVSGLFGAFADAVITWNLEDRDGTPVPATLAALYEQEFGFVLALVMEWIHAIAGVSAPLDPDSNGGAPSGVVSIPTETLSPSR